MFDDNMHRRRWPDGGKIGAVPDSPADLETDGVESDSVRWNRFDTFLRRAFMIGLTLVVWLTFWIGAVWCVDRMLPPLLRPGLSDVYPSDAPSLLACEPEDVDC